MSLLELSGVVKSFVGVEQPVLRGVNLRLGAGDLAEPLKLTAGKKRHALVTLG